MINPDTTAWAGNTVNQNPSISVAVVDDELVIRTLLKRGFGDSGYRVDTYESAHSALHHITLAEESLKPAIILTDLCMPSMSGIEFYLKSPAHMKGRFLFMTGNAPPNFGEFKERHNIDDFRVILKPFTLNDITRKVREFYARLSTPAISPPTNCRNCLEATLGTNSQVPARASAPTYDVGYLFTRPI